MHKNYAHKRIYTQKFGEIIAHEEISFMTKHLFIGPKYNFSMYPTFYHFLKFYKRSSSREMNYSKQFMSSEEKVSLFFIMETVAFHLNETLASF